MVLLAALLGAAPACAQGGPAEPPAPYAPTPLDQIQSPGSRAMQERSAAAPEAVPGHAGGDVPVAVGPVAAETDDGAVLLSLVARQNRLFAELADDPALDTDPRFEAEATAIARDYEFFLARQPQHLEGLLLYGKYLRRVGQAERALGVFRQADAVNPRLPVVKQMLGNHLAENEQPAEALGFFLQAVQLAPGEPVYHYSVGELIAQYRLELARAGIARTSVLEQQMADAFAEAARLAPQSKDFAYRHAEALLDRLEPDWSGALKVFERLSGMAETPLEREAVALQRARVLGQLGRAAEARTLLAMVREPSLLFSRDQVARDLDAAGPTP